jgi:hypothetical protein
MMSIRTTLRSACSDDLDRLPAIRRAQDVHLLILQDRRQREDVARVVVDDEHPPAAQHLTRAVKPLDHLPLALGKIRDDAVQEQRRLVEQALGRLDVLEHDALRDRVQLRLFLLGELLAGEHDDGNLLQVGLGPQLFEKLEAAHVRQP